MSKPLLILSFCLLLLKTVDGQSGVVLYGLKNSKLVSVKDSAQYFIEISPPDTSVDKRLFRVRIFNSKGKIRVIGSSYTNNLNFKFQGAAIAFFVDGRKMRISNYSNGELVGDVIDYYPNGKLYTIKSYAPGKAVYLKQCNDSTGNVLAENGNGKWINFFNQNFKGVFSKGDVKNGLEEGEWHGELTNEYFVYKYHLGKLFSFDFQNKQLDSLAVYDPVFPSGEFVPEYPGGLDALGKFLEKNIRYPHKAVENNTSGRVIISFIVDTDGSVIDAKVVRGIGDGCDEEALRVIKLFPKWKPGIQNNRAVRVLYSVPVSFGFKN